MKKLMMSLVGIAALGAVAADAVFIGTNRGEANPLEHAECWQDGYIPQDGDNIYFNETITAGSGVYKANLLSGKNTIINILTGFNWMELYLRDNRNTTIADTTDFLGTLRLERAATLILPTDGTQVNKFYAEGVARVNNAGATTIESALGEGVLQKSGAGELTVKKLGGNKFRIRAKEGTITLGEAKTAEEARSLEELLAAATFHVDANVESSLVKSGDVVTKWSDVRGDGYPFATVPEGFGAPQLEDDPISGGKRMNFGSLVNIDKASSEVLATARAMVWSKSINDIKTLFMVVGDSVNPGNNRPFFLGDTGGFAMHRGDGRTLFNTGFANRNIFTSKIWHNGTRSSYDKVIDYGVLQTIGMQVTEGTTYASTFARDRTSVAGGIIIGEVILFNEELSAAEFAKVNNYLLAKWQKTSVVDVDCVTLGNGVGLNTDGDITMNELEVQGTTLNKGGAGTLTVGQMSGAVTAVNVNGGAVKFGAALLAPDAESGVAADAKWHFDASDEDSLELDTIGGTNYVARWHDTEDYSRSATAEQPTYHAPFIAEDTLNGKPYVSFGEYWDSAHGSLDSNCARLYFENNEQWLMEGFMVVRDVDGIANGNPFYIGHTGDFPIHRGLDNPAKLLSDTAANLVAIGGKWSVDGVSVNPMEYACGGEFHVIHFSFSKPLKANLIGGDRNIPCRVGGVCVAEMVLYAHGLTDDEVRNTEAYLMKKWLNKEHPAAHPQELAIAMNFNGAEPVVNTDQDITLASVNGEGELVKAGAGALSLGALGMNSLNVQEGNVTFAPMLDRSAFHVDASVAGSIVSDEDGILIWKDVRGEGYPTASAADAAERPTLIDDATSGLKFMDFGEYRGGEPFNTPFMEWSKAIKIKEVIVVGGDHNDVHTSSFFVGDTSGFPWHRGSYGEIYNDGWSGGVLKDENALCTYDGEIVDGTTQVVGDGLHVFSLRMAGTSTFKTFARDRSFCRTGGVKIAEVLVFEDYLSDAERTRIVANLRAKWQKISSSAIALDAVTAADATTVDFNGEGVSVGTVSGGGTLKAARISDTTTINATQGAPLTVDGEFALAANGVINFTATNPTAGEYEILSADELLNAANISAWRVVLDDAVHMSARPVVKDNTLYVNLAPLGTLVIIR